MNYKRGETNWRWTLDEQELGNRQHKDGKVAEVFYLFLFSNRVKKEAGSGMVTPQALESGSLAAVTKAAHVKNRLGISQSSAAFPTLS